MCVLYKLLNFDDNALRIIVVADLLKIYISDPLNNGEESMVDTVFKKDWIKKSDGLSDDVVQYEKSDQDVLMIFYDKKTITLRNYTYGGSLCTYFLNSDDRKSTRAFVKFEDVKIGKMSSHELKFGSNDTTVSLVVTFSASTVPDISNKFSLVVIHNNKINIYNLFTTNEELEIKSNTYGITRCPKCRKSYISINCPNDAIRKYHSGYLDDNQLHTINNFVDKFEFVSNQSSTIAIYYLGDKCLGSLKMTSIEPSCT